MQGRADQSEATSEDGPVSDQPGLGKLRDAVANRPWLKPPGVKSLRRDALAGLSGAISNVPDGMANGVLVGVNPVYGLYAAMMGPAVGGLFSSTQLMMITTTAAATLSTSQALGGLQGEARAEALFTMVILVGVFQILFGLLKLGKLLRFVSYSVTTGFLSGVSILLNSTSFPWLRDTRRWAAIGSSKRSICSSIFVKSI
jgi:sulfate permease, SulP family